MDIYKNTNEVENNLDYKEFPDNCAFRVLTYNYPIWMHKEED